MIKAGELIHRVRVQQLVAPSADPLQTDAFNSPVSPAKDENWETVCERWCAIKPVSGMEIFQGQQVRPDITHGITMRWFPKVLTHGYLDPGVDARMRLLFRKRALYVRSCVDLEERRIELAILAIEQVK